MSQIARPVVATLLVVALFALMAPGIALAHERRTIAGKYDVVVGFDKEPAYVNQPNAASIRIMRTGTQDPVEGAEKTLKVQIAFGGGAAREFPLRTVFGQKGYYVADFLPTRAGRYIFTFVGTIEGTPVNERFESGPGRFDDVQGVEALQFPQTVPDPLTLANEIKAARDEATTSRTLAIAGLVVGIAGLIVGGFAFATRRRLAGTLAQNR